MCNMLVSKTNENNKEFEFIVYNVVFSETSGIFTTDYVYEQLKNHEIHANKEKLNELFGRWADNGLIFENANEYVINSTVGM